MQFIGFALFVLLGCAVGWFIFYAIENSPTARRGKYTCYGDRDGKVCFRPISAERARAGRDCEVCESK